MSGKQDEERRSQADGGEQERLVQQAQQALAESWRRQATWLGTRHWAGVTEPG